MKKYLKLFLVLIVFASCQQKERELQIDGDHEENEILLSANAHASFADTIHGFAEQIYYQFGTAKSKVHNYFCNEVLITVQDTVKNYQSYSFDCVDSVEVFIQSGSLPEMRIAWKNDSSDNHNMMQLSVAKDNLKEYLLNDKIYVRTNVIYKKNTHVNFLMRIRFLFRGSALGYGRAKCWG